jgi:hypothetical protein
VPVARQIVTKLLDGRLVFTPREDRTCDFSGRVSLGGLLQGTVYREVWLPRAEGDRVVCEQRVELKSTN